MDPLPGYLFDEILSRVPPRDLASCRCVCSAWRAAVDGLGLLAAHVLPHSLDGIFINFFYRGHSALLARRSTSAPTYAVFGFMPRSGSIQLFDHCNGLCLGYGDSEGFYYVCNPATRRSAKLPPHRWYPINGCYLAFDPAVSPHYYAIRFPDPADGDLHLRWKRQKTEEGRRPDAPLEWPPRRFEMLAFSSRTSRWEEREFVREGDAVVTWDDAVSAQGLRCNAVYHRGALYVHCRGDFLTKLYLSDDKYQVIKMPKFGEAQYADYNVGRSEKGVYYAAVHKCQLQVWALDESSRPMEWIFNYDLDLKPLAWKIQTLGNAINTPTWIMHCDTETRKSLEGYFGVADSDSEDNRGSDYDSEDNGDLDYDSEDNRVSDYESQDNRDSDYDSEDNRDSDYDSEDNRDSDYRSEDKEKNDENDQWNSDDDYTLDIEHNNIGNFDSYLSLLGFHPYKEVVFLGIRTSVVAWHLRDSKAQYLGRLWPSWLHVDAPERIAVYRSFPYTPCLVDSLPTNK